MTTSYNHIGVENDFEIQRSWKCRKTKFIKIQNLCWFKTTIVLILAIIVLSLNCNLIPSITWTTLMLRFYFDPRTICVSNRLRYTWCIRRRKLWPCQGKTSIGTLFDCCVAMFIHISRHVVIYSCDSKACSVSRNSLRSFWSHSSLSSSEVVKWGKAAMDMISRFSSGSLFDQITWLRSCWRVDYITELDYVRRGSFRCFRCHFQFFPSSKVVMVGTNCKVESLNLFFLGFENQICHKDMYFS